MGLYGGQSDTHVSGFPLFSGSGFPVGGQGLLPFSLGSTPPFPRIAITLVAGSKSGVVCGSQSRRPLTQSSFFLEGSSWFFTRLLS